jgi:hypothetical protein
MKKRKKIKKKNQRASLLNKLVSSVMPYLCALNTKNVIMGRIFLLERKTSGNIRNILRAAFDKKSTLQQKIEVISLLSRSVRAIEVRVPRQLSCFAT